MKVYTQVMGEYEKVMTGDRVSWFVDDIEIAQAYRFSGYVQWWVDLGVTHFYAEGRCEDLDAAAAMVEKVIELAQGASS